MLVVLQGLGPSARLITQGYAAGAALPPIPTAIVTAWDEPGTEPDPAYSAMAEADAYSTTWDEPPAEPDPAYSSMTEF